ncbi:MAG: hypothetical protein ACRBDL_08215 [Alphaproteobacteria bacterium]
MDISNQDDMYAADRALTQEAEKSFKKILDQKNSNTQMAGFTSNIYLVGCGIFADMVQPAIERYQDTPEIPAALATVSLFSAYQSLACARDVRGENVTEFVKGFIAPPLMAGALYLGVEGTDFSDKDFTLRPSEIYEQQTPIVEP